MKARLIRDSDDGVNAQPKGTVLEGPSAFRLVMNGIAEPADEECQAELARRGWTAEKQAAAAQATDKLRAGLVTEKDMKP